MHACLFKARSYQLPTLRPIENPYAVRGGVFNDQKNSYILYTVHKL